MHQNLTSEVDSIYLQVLSRSRPTAVLAFAWRVVLGEKGVIAAVRSPGVNDTPEWLLFGNFAVVRVISTMFVPFVIAFVSGSRSDKAFSTLPDVAFPRDLES